MGEDWIAPQTDEAEAQARPRGRDFWTLKNSPLARKIIMFNLMAQVILVAGVMFMNPFHNSLVEQRQKSFATEAQLLADVVSASMHAAGGPTFEAVLKGLRLSSGNEAYLFDAQGDILAHHGDMVLSDRDKREDFLRDLLPQAQAAGIEVEQGQYAQTGPFLAAAAPLRLPQAGAITFGLISAEGEIENLILGERLQILRMVILGLVISIGLSLVLASTIANPLADLASAAEIGQDRDARKLQAGRIRIPDLAGRPDEIGRLSIAMRGMVAALYDRIDSNEQFAADVAHEIKNPLASLRSAVASMRLAKRDDQREKLLEVIDHDVRRLDRLVSDISNASRLDSELVKEQEEIFNLTKTLGNLCSYLSQQAETRGVELITDFPDEPINLSGLEARLAQVFVNLITNAISFCENGDAVRVWARKRANRVLVVVEDTGPGIPEQALSKIFKRFYSERPQGQFGNNSGLGLSISKQIVEAHGGVIWAENIRPTQADAESDPLGARFVVGLPG